MVVEVITSLCVRCVDAPSLCVREYRPPATSGGSSSSSATTSTDRHHQHHQPSHHHSHHSCSASVSSCSNSRRPAHPHPIPQAEWVFTRGRGGRGGVKDGLAPTRVAPGLPQACPRPTLSHQPSITPPLLIWRFAGAPHHRARWKLGGGKAASVGGPRKRRRRCQTTANTLWRGLGWDWVGARRPLLEDLGRRPRTCQIALLERAGVGLGGGRATCGKDYGNDQEDAILHCGERV